ncbi:MAG TPA: hypothetical protein ENN67_01760 [Firmicutes bacterium]|nr:hypothetical protein [Bacillota bacterium]
MVRYQGKSVGTWKIVDEERINNTMTCRCNICGHKIVLERKHIGTLKKRRCPACLEKRNSLHRNKVMYVLFSAGYSYDAIADYFGIKRITAKEKIVRERERFVPPDILVPRPDYRDKPGKEIRKKIKKSRAKG